MQGRNNETVWTWVMMIFLKKVVPHAMEAITKTRLSEWCTPASEALLFVLIENNYDQWQALYADKDSIPAARYTDQAKSGYKYQGWSQRGIARYNEIMKQIEDGQAEDEEKEKLNPPPKNFQSMERKLLLEARKVLKDKKARTCVQVHKEMNKRPRCSMPKNFAFWDQPKFEGDKENLENEVVAL